MKHKNEVKRRDLYPNQFLKDVSWGIQPQDIPLYPSLERLEDVRKGWRRREEAKDQGMGQSKEDAKGRK